MVVYIAFTEEQAQEIRSHGISVVRFKWLIKNSISIIQWCVMQFRKAIQKFADALRVSGSSPDRTIP